MSEGKTTKKDPTQWLQDKYGISDQRLNISQWDTNDVAEFIDDYLLEQCDGETSKTRINGLNLQDVNGWLTIKEVAVRYGRRVKCKWLDPIENKWIDKTMTITAYFIVDYFQGNIKEACR